MTGTAATIYFSSYGADDTIRGGAGNDRFTAIGGHDIIVSNSNDADQFTFITDYFYHVGQTDITGFNGAGTVEGDQIHFLLIPVIKAKLDVSTQGEKTTSILRRPLGQHPCNG